jgi:hypothetical protein
MKSHLRFSSIVPLLACCQWACPAGVSCWQQFPAWQTVEVMCLSTRILPLQSWGNYTNLRLSLTNAFVSVREFPPELEC